MNTTENIVIASSHDMELLTLLGDDFTKAYFIESIVDNHLSFEFKLKIGEQEARNAIRIIEMEGFPEAIVKAAIRQTDISREI
ncbi:MAG: hypothetical protein EOO02_21925 [Chitinophagaceae bacterium]|nr:MAG: hypothetical protein EOO02_21925 [Chitinophagaceae bacterium]